MKDKTDCTRVRAPLGDADRLTISLAARQCVRDEVLDVVIERLAIALGYGAGVGATPALRLHPGALAPGADTGGSAQPGLEPRANAWGGLTNGPVVRIMPRESPVLARIG
jgi:hypothetical protein